MLAMTYDTIYLLAPKKMTTGQIHLLSGAKTGEKTNVAAFGQNSRDVRVPHHSTAD